MPIYYVTAVIVIEAPSAQAAVSAVDRQVTLDHAGEPVVGVSVTSPDGEDTEIVMDWDPPVAPGLRCDEIVSDHAGCRVRCRHIAGHRGLCEA